MLFQYVFLGLPLVVGPERDDSIIVAMKKLLELSVLMKIYLWLKREHHTNYHIIIVVLDMFILQNKQNHLLKVPILLLPITVFYLTKKFLLDVL